MTYKVHYFGAPARAEVSRLCLTLGGIPYEDIHYTRDTWPSFKPKTPFGQVPVLEFPDGTLLGQSMAIDRYCAKLAGLYPEDPREAAMADQASFLLEDMTATLVPTFSMADEAERVKARKDLLAGKLGDLLQHMEKLMASIPKDGYIAGSKLSYADLHVFVWFSGTFGGNLDGVARQDLERYPAIKAFRNRIASLPKIKAHYEKAEGAWAILKPDA